MLQYHTASSTFVFYFKQHVNCNDLLQLLREINKSEEDTNSLNISTGLTSEAPSWVGSICLYGLLSPHLRRAPPILASLGKLVSYQSFSPISTPAHQSVQVSFLSIFNTLQTYLSLPSLALTRRVYSGPATTSSTQVTPLFARTFGTWTFLSAIVRLYASYHIHNREMFALALWTFVIAVGHFGSEWAVYGTVRMGKGFAPSAIVAVSSMAWMVWQWGAYVQSV